MKVTNCGVSTWRPPHIELRVDREFIEAAIELMETKIVEDAANKDYNSITEKANAREGLIEALQEYLDWAEEQASKEPDGEDE